MLNKRVLLCAGLLAAAVAGWAAYAWLSRPSATPVEALVVALATSPIGFPVIVAERQGFFAAEGLDVTLRRYPFGRPALEAMLAGDAEVATVAETPVVFASLQGKTFRVIANYMSSDRQSIVARADRGIARIEDLSGRRVGVSVGTSANYLLYVMLSDAGLGEKDVELVPLDGPQQAAALSSGQVDAVAGFPPFTTACQRALAGRAVVFLPGLRYAGLSSLAVAGDFSQRRPEAALRLLRAIDRALDWMQANRGEAMALAVDELGIDRAALEAVWDEWRPGLSLDQGLVLLLEAEARWAIKSGLVPRVRLPNYLDYIDASPLRRLRREAVTVISAS